MSNVRQVPIKKPPSAGGKDRVYLSRRSNGNYRHSKRSVHYYVLPMFNHLINGEYHPEIENTPAGSVVTPIANQSAADIIDAKVKTADWLKQLGAIPDDEIETAADSQAVRAAFATMVTGGPPQDTKLALTNVKTPQAVRHLVGMLTAYDWAFVEQAKELRGYAVSQILEETKNPDTRFRLKALEMLGKVTEVALFTERVEIKKTDMSDNELEQRIKEKLNKFMHVIDVVDVPVNEPTNTDQPE